MPGMKERNNDVKYIEDGTRQRKTTVTGDRKAAKDILSDCHSRVQQSRIFIHFQVSAVSGNGWKCEETSAAAMPFTSLDGVDNTA